MKRLWDVFDGEPFLDNPSVYVINTNRRKKTMRRYRRNRAGLARDARGRFVRTGSRARIGTTVATVHRRKKRHYTMPRKRHVVRAHHRRGTHVRRHMSNPYFRRRRRYRRNPVLFGLELPNIQTVGYTVAGVAATPFVEGFVQKNLIDSLELSDKTAKTVVNYAVKVASAYGVSYAIGMFAGGEAKKAALIGGLAYVGVSALSDLGLLPTSSEAKKEVKPAAGRYLSAQPLLGAYRPMGSFVTAATPSRLQPQSRF